MSNKLATPLIMSAIFAVIGAITFYFVGTPFGPSNSLSGAIGGFIGGAVVGFILGFVPDDVWSILTIFGECCSIFGVLFVGSATTIITLLFSHNLLFSITSGAGAMALAVGGLAVGIWVDRMRRGEPAIKV